jgi:hypothetical protein
MSVVNVPAAPGQGAYVFLTRAASPQKGSARRLAESLGQVLFSNCN